MNKKSYLLAIAVVACAGHAMAQSQSASGPWLVRARIAHLDPANKSDPIGGVGPADLITVNSKTLAEVDVSYFFTPNIAAEFLISTPQKFKTYVAGVETGSFKATPPTLLVQYHFMPEARISPYVGAGINYTRFSNVNIAGGAATLEKSSTGAAFQVGADYKLDQHWSLNLDVKKVQVRSDVLMGGARISTVKLDPLAVGVGVGYRF